MKVVSALVQAGEADGDGEALSREETVSIMLQMLFAGHASRGRNLGRHRPVDGSVMAVANVLAASTSTLVKIFPVARSCPHLFIVRLVRP